VYAKHSFYCLATPSTNTIKEVRRKSTEWEKFHKPVCDLYLEYKQNYLNSMIKKRNNPTLKWAKNLSRHFSKEGA
jgi:hypothetical protein